MLRSLAEITSSLGAGQRRERAGKVLPAGFTCVQFVGAGGGWGPGIRGSSLPTVPSFPVDILQSDERGLGDI